jgi:hypothetical protein
VVLLRCLLLQTSALVLLLVLVMLLILHSAWVVLPVYCLCMTASKDSQKYITSFMEMLRR